MAEVYSTDMAELPYKLFRNYRIPKGANEDYFHFAADRVPDEGDIFIVSYPKCGTTWLQFIVYLLVEDGRPPLSTGTVVSSIPFLEQDGISINHKPIAYKYHLPFELMNVADKAKYLYVARNPKDACVSAYHFLKRLPGYKIESFDFFFEAFLAGEIPYGDIMDHFLSWYEASSRDNILFLTYESLAKERKETVFKIARFLGYHGLSEQTLKNILQYSEFEYMKNLEARDDFMTSYLTKCTGSFPTEGKKPQMMRSGVVGDWRNYLSPLQSLKMNNYFKKKTNGTNMQHMWNTEMDL